MVNIYHKKYTNFDLKNNKGYGTQRHIDSIKKYGESEVHRKSFKHKGNIN